MDAERKVDVLDVMCEAAMVLVRDGHKAIPEDLMEARDAVAELIDAIKENRIVTQDFANDGCPANYFRYEESERRVMAAISRLGASA